MRHPLLAAVAATLMLSLSSPALQAQAVSGDSPAVTAGGTTSGTRTEPERPGDAPAGTGTSGQPGALPPVAPPATEPNTSSGRPDSQRWERTHRASRIIGVEVRNREGDRIGRIEDVVLDGNGRAAYAIVSTGGFLGIGDRLHAVPWALLQTHNANYHLLDIDRDRLRQAPSFDERAWPNFNDERWVRDNQRYFGGGR